MITHLISHYELLEKLGEGGMGVVFKAIDKRLGRTVAIKMVNAGLTKRFEREAKAISALNHPHICTIHDIGEHEGVPYLVMEYIDGQPLKGPRPVEEVLRIAMQICEALAAAHKAGVIHRDLKPENILLTSEGTVKVLDFGLAKVQSQIAPDATTLTMTEPGVIAGTAPYMSPEQASGEPEDGRSDIFSFGAVLYELLTGRPAFRRESRAATIAAILALDPPPLREAPPKVVRIVHKMLAKRREDRYQSAEELLDDLKAASGPQPLLVSRRSWVAVPALLVIAAAVIAGWNLSAVRRLPRRGTRPPPAVRLAVLPFANLSRDPEQEYLSDGLTQEMIAQLGRLHAQRLSVIARTSVMRYKNSDKPIDQVGRELGVDYVLEGSARREARRIRVTAELIEARSQIELWSESYESDLADILALQSEVAGKVAQSLALQLLPAARAARSNPGAVNAEAYDAYLKGLAMFYRSTPADLDRAQKYFEAALKEDPKNARAYAGVALVWGTRQQFGFARPAEAGRRAEAAAETAVALDDTAAEGHYALALVRAWTDWDWAAAEREFRRAIEINPSFPDPRALYSHLLMQLRRPQEALSQIEQALRHDPFNPFSQTLYAVDLLYLHRYDEAIAEARKSSQIVPDHANATWVLWNAYSLKGMTRDALVAAKTCMSLYGDPAVDRAFDRGNARGGYAAAMGLAADALARHFRTSYANPTDVALLYLGAREKTKALDWLEKALDLRDPNVPYLGLPQFDALRAEPRFQAVLRRIHLE